MDAAMVCCLRAGGGASGRLCLCLAALTCCYVAAYTYVGWVQSPVQIVRESKLTHREGFRQAASTLGLHHLAAKLPDASAVPLGLGVHDVCRASVRLGHVERGADDGGWNLCTLPQWQTPRLGRTWTPPGCVVYSFGSNWDFSFELAAARLGCEVHTFDPSMPGFAGSEADHAQERDFGIHFHAAGLGPRRRAATCTAAKCEADGAPPGRCPCAWELDTLAGFMARLGHERVGVVKIDCEGCEWDVLESLLQEAPPTGALDGVRQLVVELHLRAAEPERGVRILRGLAERGFVAWNRDENMQGGGQLDDWGGVHARIYQELSYLNREASLWGEAR